MKCDFQNSPITSLPSKLSYSLVQFTYDTDAVNSRPSKAISEPQSDHPTWRLQLQYAETCRCSEEVGKSLALIIQCVSTQSVQCVSGWSNWADSVPAAQRTHYVTFHTGSRVERPWQQRYYGSSSNDVTVNPFPGNNSNNFQSPPFMEVKGNVVPYFSCK